MKLTIHTDGGARGNPGPAAVGFVIESDKNPAVRIGKTIGETTNNVAEYSAVIEALRWVRGHISNLSTVSELDFFLDSTLVVNQLNGLFKVKDARLRELLTTIRSLEQEVGGHIHYAYIPREQNKTADLLVNQALDKEIRDM